MEKKIENMLWILIGLVVLVAAISIIMAAIGGFPSNGTYGTFGMMGGYYGMVVIMPIIGAISVIFVLVFIYFFLDMLRGTDTNHHNYESGSAENIAKERFARGEITAEEYSKIISTIRK